MIPTPISSPPQRDERYQRWFRDMELYLGLYSGIVSWGSFLQGDILGHIKRDIFNLLDILNILKDLQLITRRELIIYTKYLKVKRSKRVGVKYLTITFSHWRKVVQKISHQRKSVRKFSHQGMSMRKFSHQVMSMRNFFLALRSCLQMAITSSFQLQIAHRLKSWTPDFPSFEMIYRM